VRYFINSVRTCFSGPPCRYNDNMLHCFIMQCLCKKRWRYALTE